MTEPEKNPLEIKNRYLEFEVTDPSDTRFDERITQELGDVIILSTKVNCDHLEGSKSF